MPPIQILIPQAPPFVMIDTLLEATNQTASTKYKITNDNPLVTNGYFTEAGLMENMAQTAAAKAGYSAMAANKPVEIGYIGAVKNLVITALPKVGDELITEIQIAETVFDMTVITARVTCNNEVMATCEMKIFIQK